MAPLCGPASLQVSAAVSPDNEATNSFRECVIIRHPRRDCEFALAFITGQTVLQVGLPSQHPGLASLALPIAP